MQNCCSKTGREGPAGGDLRVSCPGQRAQPSAGRERRCGWASGLRTGEGEEESEWIRWEERDDEWVPLVSASGRVNL